MGKDFRIGLIMGLVLGVVALIWVATRPSLTPEARMRQTLQARSQDLGLRTENLRLQGATGVNSQSEAPNPPLREAGPSVADSQRDASTPEDTPPTTDESVSATDSGPNLRSAIRGVQRSDLPDLTIYEQAEPIKTTRFHIVRRGETLSAIARQYYNSPNDWPKIVAANSSIKDANRIAPGTKLTIPE